MASRPDATARESLRIAQVYHTVLRYMLDMVVDHGPLAGVRRRFQFWLHDVPQEPVALDTAAKTRLLLQELGPTYVKVGQLVSSQSQVLPDDWERELARLQQNVAPFPYEQVHRIVVAELGAPPEDLYEHFDEVPLAAASLGQVHRPCGRRGGGRQGPASGCGATDQGRPGNNAQPHPLPRAPGTMGARSRSGRGRRRIRQERHR
jgi:hypothetical protein